MERPSVNKKDEDQESFENFEGNAVSSKLPSLSDPEVISLCNCILGESDYFGDTSASKQKQKILSHVARTEAYLRERRISELIRFILAKIMCDNPKRVTSYVVDLLDDCMIFRAGLGKAPVLFEERHIKEVVKSFDPGDRGWLSSGQVRRAYTVLGLTLKNDLEDKTPTSEVLDLLRDAQEQYLLSLLCAGSDMEFNMNLNNED